LQRFFSNVEFDLDKLGLFLVSLFFESDDAMYLALDRTNWKYGKKNVNILVLAAVYRGVAIPIRWKLLDKQGNSNTEERTKIVSDFIEVFGSHRIAGLLGDREFIGKEWFKYLQNCGIPFVMRIKENTLVMNKGTELHVRNPYSGTPKDVVHLKFPERPDSFKLNFIIVFLWVIGGLFSASESLSSSNHWKRRIGFNHQARVYVPGDAEERDGQNLGVITLEAQVRQQGGK
jgi:hypothetical protein